MNQAFLPGRSMCSVANLENKPRRPAFHKRCILILEMIQERALYVVGFADINPFTRI